MGEKRFDVRVPLANTHLLEQLAEESARTGIAESRLLVLYATRYVEALKGMSAPIGGHGAPVATNGPVASHGHNGHESPQEHMPQGLLTDDALDTMFGDPD